MEFTNETEIFGFNNATAYDIKEGLQESIKEGYGIKIRMKVGGINPKTEKGNISFTTLTEKGTQYITLYREEGQEVTETELSKYIDKEIEILNVLKSNGWDGTKPTKDIYYNTIYNPKDIKILGECDGTAEGSFDILYDLNEPLTVKDIMEDILSIPKIDSKTGKKVYDKRGNPETTTSKVLVLRMVGRNGLTLVNRSIAMVNVKNKVDLEKYLNKKVMFKNYMYSEQFKKNYSLELPTIVEETKKQEVKQPETK